MRNVRFRAFCQNSVIKGVFNVDMIDFQDNLITLRHRDNTDDIEMVDLDVVRLLQYTGQKDENGCEIYESDIIEFLAKDDGETYKAKIVFENLAFRALDIEDEGYEYDFDNLTDIEVVGNIYENSELLKDAK